MVKGISASDCFRAIKNIDYKCTELLWVIEDLQKTKQRLMSYHQVLQFDDHDENNPEHRACKQLVADTLARKNE